MKKVLIGVYFTPLHFLLILPVRWYYILKFSLFVKLHSGNIFAQNQTHKPRENEVAVIT